VSSSERLSVAARNQLLEELVGRYPDCYVSALRLNGIPIPVPVGIAVPNQVLVEAPRAFFELIVPDDIWPAMAAWDRGRKIGAASVRLRLASDPEHFVEVHVLDFTEQHGVYLEVVVTEDGSNPWPERAPTENARARVGTMRKDNQSFVLSMDEATTDLLGWKPEQMIGHRTLEFTDPEHLTVAITTYIDMLRNPGSARRSRVRYRRADGSWLWVEVTNHNLLDDPEYGCVLAEVVDVSEEMAYQEALRSREELLRRLTDALPLGVLHVDLDGRVLYRNEQLGSILGHAHAPTLEEQFASARSEHREFVSAMLAAVRTDARDGDADIVIEAPGDVRQCRLTLRVLKDAAGAATGAVIAVSDVTDSVRMRAQLERRATTDSLTGCHTRSSIMSLLERSLVCGKSSGVGTGVIFIDLDRFKHVNDEYGHAVGDEFLAQVAQRLLAAVRQRDAVGRLGGDEFLVLCDAVASAEQLNDIAKRLSAALGDDVDLGANPMPVRASIGVAWSQHSLSAPDDLVALADDAMYAVKRARRSDVEPLPTTSSVVRAG
jgi:diguanylate cyclase (GGDEF)-like protein/PAS domain S-box-containing protein